MDVLERAVGRVAQSLALVGSLGVLALLVHVALDVGMRNLFGKPIPATNEIASRYYMVLIAFLPLGWIEQRDAMVKVELVDTFTPRQLGLATNGLVALLASVIYAAISWVTWGDAIKNWQVGSFVDVLGHQLPVWPSYFLPPIGFFLAAGVTLLRSVKIIGGVLRR